MLKKFFHIDMIKMVKKRLLFYTKQMKNMMNQKMVQILFNIHFKTKKLKKEEEHNKLIKN